MRGGRFLWFLISLALGMVLGLAAGWAAAPLRTANAGLQNLQLAYKAEYVLMVAEVYAADGNAAEAAERLAEISDRPGSRIVQEAMITGGELGYNTTDLDQMARLVQGLQTLSSEGETTP